MDRWQKLAGRAGVTVELGLLAILTGVIIAVPIGMYSAIRRYTAADYAGRAGAIFGLATPNFWLGLMVMIYPAIWWGWTQWTGRAVEGVCPVGYHGAGGGADEW